METVMLCVVSSWLYHYHQGLYSLTGKTSYHQIAWSLQAARLDVILIVSRRYLTGTSEALLSMCLSNFRAIGKVETRIWWLRDLTRSCGKMSVRLVNRSPGFSGCMWSFHRCSTWLLHRHWGYRVVNPVLVNRSESIWVNSVDTKS